jgi:hypothetical protein
MEPPPIWSEFNKFWKKGEVGVNQFDHLNKNFHTLWNTLTGDQKKAFAMYYINRIYKPNSADIEGTFEEKKKAKEKHIIQIVNTFNSLANNTLGGYRKRKTHRKSHRKTRKSHFLNMKRY